MTENPLRNRRLPRPDRQVNLPGGRQLFGDLKAGVASTDDQHRTIGNVTRGPVLGAVELVDVITKALGDRRNERLLERSSRYHDLGGPVAAVLELDEVARLGRPERTDPAIQLDRQRELSRLRSEVGNDVLATGVGGR